MAEIGKDYSFDITKAEKIFDHLLKDGQLKLPKGHVIPSADEKKGGYFVNGITQGATPPTTASFSEISCKKPSQMADSNSLKGER